MPPPPPSQHPPPIPPSIHSWWSDSNPAGPTLSLHAAAKPLMRLMYQRQAREFVKENNGVSLSRESTGVFASYLTYKYVSDDTRTLVLEELSVRTEGSDDARMLVDVFSAFEFDLLEELLRSPKSSIRALACRLLGNIAVHKSTVLDALGLMPFYQVVSLLSDSDATVCHSAVYALAKFSIILEGARAVVEADAHERISHLLHLTDPLTLKWTCQLLGNLAIHKSTSSFVQSIYPRTRLVTLSRNPNSEISKSAIFALSKIDLGLGAYRAVTDATSQRRNIAQSTLAAVSARQFTINGLLYDPRKSITQCTLDTTYSCGRIIRPTPIWKSCYVID